MRRRLSPLLLVVAVLGALVVSNAAGAAPSVPTLTAAASRDSGVALTWTAVSGATSYKVFRGLAAGFTCAAPVGSAIVGTSWTDLELLNKARYYYKVKATDATGDSVCSNELNQTPGVQPYLWDFNRRATFDQAAQEGWSGSGATWTTSGGYLQANAISNTDPQIYSPVNLGIDASLPANNVITVSIANYWTSVTTAMLFWITDADQAWDAAKSKSFTIAAGTSGVYTVTGLPASWAGTIDQIRLDPLEPGVVGPAINVWVDYLKVGTATTPPAPLTGAIFYPDFGSKEANHVPQLSADYDFVNRPFGLYDDDHPDHQKLMDEQINAARNAGIDYFAFYFSGSWDARTVDMSKYIEDFRNSTQRGAMKYMLIPILGFNICGEIPGFCYQWIGGGAYPTDQQRWRNSDVPWLLDRMDDSYYLRVDGNRPALSWCCGLDSLPTQWSQFVVGDNTTIKPDGFGDCNSANGVDGCWSDELNYLRDQALLRPIEGGGGNLGQPYNLNSALSGEDISKVTQYGFQAASRPQPTGTSWESNDHRANFFVTAAYSDAAFARTVPGVKQWPGIKAVNDKRARNCAAGVWYWADSPTYGQWEDHYRYFHEGMEQFPGRFPNPPADLIYAWNELEESGAGIAPTVSEGSMYLDAIKSVKNGAYASKYYDLVNDSVMSTTTTSTESSPTHVQELYSAGTPLVGMQFSSGWTWVSPSQFDPNNQYLPNGQPDESDDVPCAGGAASYSHTNEARGMYFNDEHTSSTAGNSMSLPWANATGFAVIAATGPDRGKADVSIDGGAPTIVDLYSSSLLRQRRVFNVTGLIAGVSHTITVTVRSDHNVASTGYKVGIDAVRAQVDRSLSAPAQTTTPPTRLLASREDARAELSWDRVPGATTYYVYRGTTNNFTPGSPLATVSEPSSSDGRVRYDNTGLSNSTTYYYVVRTGSTSGPNSTQVSASPLARLTAVSTSSNAGGSPGNATDSSHTTAWTPTNGDPGTYLYVNLAAVPNPGVSVNRFYIKEIGARVNGFKLYVSTDHAVTWIDYYTGAGIGETGASSTDYRSRSITVPIMKDAAGAEIKITDVLFQLTTTTTGGPPSIAVFHSYF